MGRSLRQHRGDALAVLVLVAISLYLTRPLLDISQTTFGDITMSAAWLNWFKESVVTFHQLPTWSPLWMGGMPFFGMVPPGVFYLILPLYLVTGSTAVTYSVSLVALFALAGLSMYLYLKHLSRSVLIAFLGAAIYIVLPVHTQSMMFWGLFEIFCAYAVMPLILLLTDLFLKRRSGLLLFLLAVCICVVIMSQIEYAVIFLLLFVPYAVFSLWSRRIGPRRLLSIAWANKIWVTITVLLLLIPLFFYLTVIREYGYFSGLSTSEIEAGLHVFTFQSFMQTFVTRAHSVMDTWTHPWTEHYSGPVSLVILLGATLLVSLERNRRHAARLLFFVLASLAFLLLAMGVYGPLFPILRQAIPVLKGMRVTLRFYYSFALCLPIVFALACLSLRSFRLPALRLPLARRLPLRLLVPVVLAAILVVDFAPYFNYYHGRVVSRQQFDQWQQYILDSVAGTQANVRLQVYPTLGTQAEYLTGVRNVDGQLRLIEMATTSLPWDQFKEVTSFYYALEERITSDEEHLAYYSKLLAIDYFVVVSGKIPPAGETLTDYQRNKVQELNALSNDPMDPLFFRGCLDNEYYRIYLYELKKTPAEFQFYPTASTIFIPSEDPSISAHLFEAYQRLGGRFTTDDFQSSVAAVWGDVACIRDPYFQWRDYRDIRSLMNARGPEASEDAAGIGEFAITAKGLSFEIDAARNGIVSVSYFYNPWWRVYVDGQESGVLRVNGVLAGTYVASGHHRVEFIFDYPSATGLIAGVWR